MRTFLFGLAIALFASSALAAGPNWKSTVKTDPMTDDKNSFLIGTSVDGKHFLRIICTNNKFNTIEYFFYGYEPDFSLKAVVRFDKNEPIELWGILVQRDRVSLATTSETTEDHAGSKYAKMLIDGFKQSNKFAIQVLDHFAEFSLGGFTSAFNRDLTNCEIPEITE